MCNILWTVENRVIGCYDTILTILSCIQSSDYTHHGLAHYSRYINYKKVVHESENTIHSSVVDAGSLEFTACGVENAVFVMTLWHF